MSTHTTSQYGETPDYTYDPWLAQQSRAQAHRISYETGWLHGALVVMIIWAAYELIKWVL